MARGQQQGTRAVTMGMVVFAALWLTSTVFLVILYTGQEDLRLNSQRVENENRKLISAAQRNSVELYKNAKAGGPTVVGLLEEARAQTARLATGEPADDPGAVGTKLHQIERMIRSDRIVPQPERFEEVPYHEALTMLYEVFKAEHALRVEAEGRVSELGAEVDRLVEAAAKQKNDFDNRARQLSDQFAAAEANRDRFRKDKEQQVAQLTQDFDQRRKESDADLTHERQRNTALAQRVAQLENRITAFQTQVGDLLIGPKVLSTARVPDGRILTAIPGDDFVFINRGQGARLVPGLRFAVYAAGKEIPPDGRAKAQIEVVSIDPHSAECQIVSVAPNEVILPGDLIANPIYDRDREVHFFVVGLFDLDHDGVADPDGTANIEALITSWGGTLSSELGALTDFMVLGAAPRQPKPPREQTPEAQNRYRQREQVYKQYVDTVQLAKTLSVPVLTQDVFLNFLGYSGREPQP